MKRASLTPIYSILFVILMSIKLFGALNAQSGGSVYLPLVEAPGATLAPTLTPTFAATVPPTATPTTIKMPTATPTVPTPTSTPCSSAMATAGLTTVQFSSSSYSVLENAGNAVITVTLSSPMTPLVTVTHMTIDDTAVVGSDYLVGNGVLIFGTGKTLKTFIVPILNDNKIEGNEKINLSLSYPICASLGVPISATLTIIDDD